MLTTVEQTADPLRALTRRVQRLQALTTLLALAVAWLVVDRHTKASRPDVPVQVVQQRVGEFDVVKARGFYLYDTDGRQLVS